ncbi:MAG: Trk family potassium uptake protein [Lachnospiraceae bacterium]|nr:Trk family potassium uptake protein [Lachnospiraceae bacterium]
MGPKKWKLTSAQVIILSFIVMIMTGTLLLLLPFAKRGPGGATFMEALFTATSASCVTGLIVQDTATYWSGFGQAVILLLIQIGGLGVVTMALAISLVSGKRIGLRERSTMQEAISAPKVGGIVKLTGFILRMTAAFELGGMVLLLPVFIRDFGFPKGVWYAMFHSISAFCNAGFDLMGAREKYSSLTSYAGNPLVVLVVSALVIIGGIGFMVWEDVRTNRLRFKRYRMQTKVVLVTSALLLTIPTILFFLLEYREGSVGSRLLMAWFQSMTARTAGFNTADLTLMSQAGMAVMIVLMLVGGSPGSTAGGMKTTTLAVLLSNMRSVFRRREDTQFFGRRIEKETVRNAATIATMYVVLFVTGGCLISRIEGLPLLTCLYETASAVGTVGVTLGITPSLGTVSRLIIVVLMYMGRVGGLTLIYATVSSQQSSLSKYPVEKITVG